MGWGGAISHFYPIMNKGVYMAGRGELYTF